MNKTTTGSAPSAEMTPENIALLIGLSTLVLVTIVGNLIVLISFVVEPKLRQPFNFFIFNLAITDFLVGITAMTFYTLDTILGYWPFGDAICAAWIYLDYAMTFASVFTLVAISIDRFWSVTWILHYKEKNTPRRTLTVILIVWLCTFIIWTPPFIGDRLKHVDEPYTCIWEPSENQEFIIVVDVIGHYLPCLIMVICYVRVYWVMRHRAIQQKKVHPLSPRFVSQTSSVPMKTSVTNVAGGPNMDVLSTAQVSPSASPNVSVSSLTHERKIDNTLKVPSHKKANADQPMEYKRESTNRERRMFVTLTYVLASYLICWFPFYVTWDFYAWHSSLVPGWLYTFFFWMTYVNSTLNPLVYGCTNKDFKIAFKKLVQCKYCR